MFDVRTCGRRRGSDASPRGRDLRSQSVLEPSSTRPTAPTAEDFALRDVPRWAVVAAAAAPTLLIGGFTIAAALQPPSYDAVRDTISALASGGATDPWVMTSALIAVGICYVLTALGLRSAHRFGRVALACGGLATLFIAIFREPLHGYSVPHALAVTTSCVMMCAWPLLGGRREHRAPLLKPRAGISAAAIILGLVLWFALEANGAAEGVAERCAAVAAALWLFPVAFTTRRAITRASTTGNSPAQRSVGPLEISMGEAADHQDSRIFSP
jgi:hypothetical membrane protein